MAIALTKAPWCDEGWFANPAYNLANHGMMGTTVLEPTGHYLDANLKGIQERTYVVVPLQLVMMAGWFKIFGFSLLAMRANGILWGLIALASLYVVVRKLSHSSTIALAAVIITALDFTFLWGAADGRMDTMSMALGMSAQAAYLALRKRKFQLAIDNQPYFDGGCLPDSSQCLHGRCSDWYF